MFLWKDNKPKKKKEIGNNWKFVIRFFSNIFSEAPWGKNRKK